MSHNIYNFFLHPRLIKEIYDTYAHVKSISARTFVCLQLINNALNHSYRKDNIIFKKISEIDNSIRIVSWRDFFALASSYDGPYLFLRELFSIGTRRMLISYLYKDPGDDISLLRSLEREEIARQDADPITLHNYVLRRIRYPDRVDPELEGLVLLLRRAIEISPHRFRRFPEELREIIGSEIFSLSDSEQTGSVQSLDFSGRPTWRRARESYALMKASSSLRGKYLDQLLMYVGKLSDGIT
jgi:hypothetical protein